MEIKKLDILKKFGYPNTLIKEYDNWYILLRVPQVTLGSLVLMCKDNTDKFSEISANSSSELPIIIKDIEKCLYNLFSYKKINYLMLMMVDNIVHYHIIPRYNNEIKLLNRVFQDLSWPTMPNLSKHNELTLDELDILKKHIKREFNSDSKEIKYNIIYTTGVFDVFHYGHLNILKKSKELCNYLFVGISTDELVKKEKDKAPLIPFDERKKIIESIRYVNEVIPQIDKDKQKVVDKYKVDAITVGDDWRGKYPKVTCDIVYIKYTPLISSSKIRKMLTDNWSKKA